MKEAIEFALSEIMDYVDDLRSDEQSDRRLVHGALTGVATALKMLKQSFVGVQGLQDVIDFDPDIILKK